jgi:hypothetical protein
VVDCVAVTLLLAGETAGGILLPGRTIGWFSPFLVGGLVLAVVRHLAWPHPSWPELARAAIGSHLSSPGTRAAWRIALLSRGLILAAGALAVMTFASTHPAWAPRVARNAVLDLPARWDGMWYLSIARHGYQWNPEWREREQNIAFFPAYPALMRVSGDAITITAKVARDPSHFGGGNAPVLWGGVLVSIICFGLALRHVYALAMLDTADASTSRRALVLLASYPFSLFYGVAYSESLALLALSGAILAWRQEDRWRSARWGILTGLVRSNGWTVSLALIADWVIRPRGRRDLAGLGAALAPLAGAALYSGYIYYRTGNPLEWAVAQRAWVGYAGPLQFATRRWYEIRQNGLTSYLLTQPVDAATAASILLMAAIAIFLLFRRQWLYAALIVAYLAPALAIDLNATGRLTSVLFPAFIAIAVATGRTSGALVATLFAAGQILLAVRFFDWKTPF